MPVRDRAARPPRPARGSAPPPAPPPVPRFAGVALPTGARLHYAEQGDSAGRAVILLHGYSDSWRSFELVLPLLPAGVRAVAPDLRGHGDSERPAAGYSMRALAADVLALMDALDLPSATLVGHSLGSFVAQQAALLAPTRVAGLVLVGSATTPRHIAGMSELERAVLSFADAERPVSAAFAREFQESTIHAPVPAGFVDGAVEGSLRLPARVWQALMRGMLATDPPAGLGAHRIPTLLTWGDCDAMMSRAEQDALLAMLPAARLTVFPDTGHAVHWERPAEFARALAGFVGAG